MKRGPRKTLLARLASAEDQLHEIEHLAKELRRRLAAVAETVHIVHAEFRAAAVKAAVRKRSLGR